MYPRLLNGVVTWGSRRREGTQRRHWEFTMRIDAYYVIRGKATLLTNESLDRDFATLLAEPMLIKHGEGGITAWTSEDHSAVVKLLFLANLKREYEHSFVQKALVSLTFFDQWWVLERIDGLDCDLDGLIENLTPELFATFEPTGNELVDGTILDLKSGAAQERRYKTPRVVYLPTGFMVLWDTKFVGYIQDTRWDLPFLRGKWKPIKNIVSEEFVGRVTRGEQIEVQIEGGPDLKGSVTIEDKQISIRMRFASKQNGVESEK
jgi:hypothetical protein